MHCCSQLSLLPPVPLCAVLVDMPSPQPAGSTPERDGARSVDKSRHSQVHHAIVDVANCVFGRAVRIEIDHVFHAASDALVEIDRRCTYAEAIRRCGKNNRRCWKTGLRVKSDVTGKEISGGEGSG